MKVNLRKRIRDLRIRSKTEEAFKNSIERQIDVLAEELDDHSKRLDLLEQHASKKTES